MKELTNEEIQYIYDYSKSKLDICKKLDIRTNQNGVKIDNDILEYFSLIGITQRDQISKINLSKHWEEIQKRDYELNPKYCAWCGKKLLFEKRFSKCCNQSCANSYSNKLRGHKTKKEREKISISLSLSRQKELKYSEKYKLISELVKDNIILNDNNYNINDKYIDISKLKIQNCVICGKLFYKRINKFGNVGSFTTCCDNCEHILKSQVSKQIVENMIKNGKHKGWQSRNIISYPEQFWIKVLDNNNIVYQREYKLYYDNINKYFLDFYIEIGDRKIDLEIDGKQHNFEDRKYHDKIRDEYIKSQGIEVYRIKWNSINNEKGKQLMKEKIDNFLEYINMGVV